MDELVNLHQTNAKICYAAINLMRELTEVYGPEKGSQLSDHINSILGDDIKYQIFFGLMTGNVGGNIVTITGFGSVCDKINAIKAIRCAVAWGLKESKDFIDQLDGPLNPAYTSNSTYGRVYNTAHRLPSGKYIQLECKTSDIATQLRNDLVSAGYTVK